MLGLTLKLPVWQAPMAGVSTPELTAAASNAGVLGSIGAGYLSGEKTEEFIRRVKQLTTADFAVNLFVPEEAEASAQQVQAARQLLAPYHKELKAEEEGGSLSFGSSAFHEQLAVVLQERVRVCSFTFGLPPQRALEQLKERGIITVGTATTVEEAVACEQAGVDAVVAQGCEAGGHRGSFQPPESMIGLMALLPQVVQEVSIPVIAAGGIMNGQGIAAALCLGASAAQLGTAFLVTEESGAHPLHKEAILAADEKEAVLTKAFSGKTARGISNHFIQDMQGHEEVFLPYPLQNTLTQSMRKQAGKQNNKEYMSLWSGQGTRLSKKQTADELVASLLEETDAALLAANRSVQNMKGTSR
ncbi:NAD(P)H-dependent flavin oxidoreductase [Bacillus badius]|uniref:Probable nitronate monooxygenase n=1 Tax=Bacillus badius TaxID=1455 RepID=A0ABR5ATK0_BACBA|nr:nitronate monooxygenase [Bacillus badius]KIL72896.1 Enoyl-[acyl-carrier-protein] reductase [Bacillus badius]KIL78087.1 Enoyl-[acyl-carrier-protein] reductase [Bacillus badius]MED4717108.1 nitronate monooxygenase [Bacillus badius]